ncbi:hypothetical protein BRADI_2g43746v3, partial [Brachypodium distachyon]
IDTHTNGFPLSTNQGQANTSGAVKRLLPWYAERSQVGVQTPGDPICQAMLQNLEEPLICTRLTLPLVKKLGYKMLKLS